MQIHWWGWAIFVGVVALLLLADLLVVHRKPHAVSTREAAIWSVVWVSLGLLFGAGIWLFAGAEFGLKFYTGYLLEKALSVDNLFVFIVIFNSFAVPPKQQHRVLFYGILGAVIMRAIFIFAGVALIERFEWVLFVFGALLIITGARLLFKKEAVESPADNRLMRWMRRIIPSTHDYRDGHFWVKENGKWLATPLLFVLLTVEFTDVIFATDSIPAIFGVTRDPFIIFSSNVFAILGLRALYFLLADFMGRFRYLHIGLALVLVFIGGKMLAEDFVHVPIAVSLSVVSGLLILAVVASWLRERFSPASGASP